MNRLRLQRFSYRFAEQVLNSKLAVKREIEEILSSEEIEIEELSRPHFNEVLRRLFLLKGWEDRPTVFDEPTDPSARFDYMKERVGIEVGFTHPSFLGIDLLKFQVASYSALNRVDVGVYIVTTKGFQKSMQKEFGQKWSGSLSFEKVVRYLPHFKSAVQVPIYVIGIDL